MNAERNKDNLRYLGRIKERVIREGQPDSFKKQTIWLDNPKSVNDDNTPNTYHKGVLLWCDAETGQKFLVKQIDLAGVSDDSKSRGFVNSIRIQLDDPFHVEKL